MVLNVKRLKHAFSGGPMTLQHGARTQTFTRQTPTTSEFGYLFVSTVFD